jgi:hypothetical protein
MLVAFQVPYVYNYITKLRRRREEIMKMYAILDKAKPHIYEYINKNVNVRLCKILNRVQKRKSPKVVHRLLCNFDTTLHVITRVFLYTY